MKFGFLNINKPTNCTSHDVVAILRKSIGIKRIGHSGTLDPFATGVLVIGINEATRLFEYLSSDKGYIASITFGTETDTNDITGKIIRESNHIPSLKEIKEKLKDLTGKIKQKPPIFSAIKINGNRAYKLARENKISEDNINERTVEIYSIKIISYSNKNLQVEIHCSSGTYIRSIARDLGKLLNSCAVLSNLQRVNIGKYFTIDNSVSLHSINELTLKERLISPISVLQLEKIYLDSKQIEDISFGKPIKIVEAYNGVPLKQLLDNNNRLIAIGTLTKDCILKPKKVFLK